jgi:polysaccharide pyruvyl transferase WcaK-like protein
LLYFLYGSGLARQLGKACFSYAVDAGKMNKVNNFATWLLSRDVKLITRSQPASDVLAGIGLPGAVRRVDTAWSMPTESPAWAEGLLRQLGWDGKQRLSGLAFQNYFIWPVVPNLPAFLKTKLTGDAGNQYKSIYYYDYHQADRARYETFRDLCAEYMDWQAEKYDIQPVIVAMEALDDVACRDLIGRMKTKAILLSCKEYVGAKIAAVLRRLSALTTTRYHAMVLSMPGAVPFVGLSRDERILGVMKEIGEYDRYYLDYRADGLAAKLRDRAAALLGDSLESKRYRDVIERNLPYYFAQMAMLGLDIRRFIAEKFPQFELPKIAEDDPEDLAPYVPPALRDATRMTFAELKAADGL